MTMLSPTRGTLLFEQPQMKHAASWGTPWAAQATTAASAASLAFLSAWYCSAPPPRAIFLHFFLWPLAQCSCWHAASQ